jgi:threonine/homoserine/homoserine lactone efflux protein
MSPEILIAFTLASTLLALTPGPNMSLILANTLSRGLSAGFMTLAGTSTGLSLLVAGAVAGMSSAMVFFSEWFDALRWAGALYLVYLGARQLGLYRRPAADLGVAAARHGARHGGCYLQGILVSLSNPKVLLFLTAFLPQFVDPRVDPMRQLAVLALLFIAVLVLVDVACALAAARARTAFGRVHTRLIDTAAGIMLLLGGLALALVRRP